MAKNKVVSGDPLEVDNEQAASIRLYLFYLEQLFKDEPRAWSVETGSWEYDRPYRSQYVWDKE